MDYQESRLLNTSPPIAAARPKRDGQQGRGNGPARTCFGGRGDVLLVLFLVTTALGMIFILNGSASSEDREGLGGGAATPGTSAQGEGARAGEAEKAGRQPDGRGSRSGGVLSAEEEMKDALESQHGAVDAAEGLNAVSKTAQLCDAHMQKYEIVPQVSWGSAPPSIQEAWKSMRCDQELGDKGFNIDDPPTGGRERAIVVVWDRISGWLEYQTPSFVKAARETCATECVFTSDRTLLPRADAVLYHGPTHMKNRAHRQRTGNAKSVFVNLEPLTYAPIDRLMRDKEYMSTFDLTMTYEKSSDVPLGYVASLPSSYYFQAPKAAFDEKDGFGEPDAVAAFVSNCKLAGALERIDYMKELMDHAKVHSYGGCLNNRKEPVIVPGNDATSRQENKVEVLRRYKFLLAFENDDQLRDYVTEKVYNGLQAGTLPVYWGAENVDEYVPRGSIVKAADFKSPQALAIHLTYLAEHEEAYEAYFAWKSDTEEEKRFQEDVVSHSAYGVNAMCRLCDRVLQDP